MCDFPDLQFVFKVWFKGTKLHDDVDRWWCNMQFWMKGCENRNNVAAAAF